MDRAVAFRRTANMFFTPAEDRDAVVVAILRPTVMTPSSSTSSIKSVPNRGISHSRRRRSTHSHVGSISQPASAVDNVVVVLVVVLLRSVVLVGYNHDVAV
jgi:hypothetical protein